jgi:hypothetical protein
MTEKSDEKHASRWTKGQSGNPNGKPKGARHAVTLLAEKLLEDEAGEIIRAVIDAAKGGDMTAARLVLERIAPPRKGRAVAFDLPDVQSLGGVVAALGAVVAAVAGAELSPEEGTIIAGLLEIQRRTIEATDFEQRLIALENKV